MGQRTSIIKEFRCACSSCPGISVLAGKAIAIHLPFFSSVSPFVYLLLSHPSALASQRPAGNNGWVDRYGSALQQ